MLPCLFSCLLIYFPIYLFVSVISLPSSWLPCLLSYTSLPLLARLPVSLLPRHPICLFVCLFAYFPASLSDWLPACLFPSPLVCFSYLFCHFPFILFAILTACVLLCYPAHHLANLLSCPPLPFKYPVSFTLYTSSSPSCQSVCLYTCLYQPLCLMP